MLKDVFLAGLGILIVIPFLPMIITNMTLRPFMQIRKKRKRIAFEVGTPFFLLAIYILVDVIYGVKILWVIFLIILFFATLATIVQWRVNEELNILKIGRATFRVVFPLSLFAYIILMVNGLVVYYLKFVYE